jgi:hypothetical protein
MVSLLMSISVLLWLFGLSFRHRQLFRLLSNRKSIAKPFGYIGKHSSASLRSRTYFPFEQLDQSVIFRDPSSIYSAL